MRIARGNLILRKGWLANPGRNGIQFNTQVRNHPIQFPQKIIATDDALVGQFRDRFCQTFLGRLQPKRARPWRTRSVQLMENRHELAARLLSQLLQDRQQAKRNAALLESVVHVMEQDMIVLLNLLHRNDFEPANVFHGHIESRKHGLRFESFAQFLGDRESVVSDPVDSARDFRNDLEKCAQAGIVDLCRPSAASYSRIVSAAICSQRNLSAICRLFIDRALQSVSLIRKISSARSAIAFTFPDETKNSRPSEAKICRGPGTS